MAALALVMMTTRAAETGAGEVVPENDEHPHQRRPSPHGRYANRRREDYDAQSCVGQRATA